MVAVAYGRIPTIHDASASLVGSREEVTADGAVEDCQAGGGLGKVVDAAAVKARRVARDGAVGHGQYCAVVDTPAFVAAAKASHIIADRAVAKCQAALVENAASSRTQSVGDGQAGHGHVRREIIEHPEGGVAIDRQIGRAGTVDRHTVGDLKFAAGQQDCAGDTGGVDSVCRARQASA
jgi:hypothetical protein